MYIIYDYYIDVQCKEIIIPGLNCSAVYLVTKIPIPSIIANNTPPVTYQK